MLITPTHHFPTAKTAIGPEDYTNIRPEISEPSDQELQYGPAMFGGIDIGWA
jgi:hypothetical protein